MSYDPEAGSRLKFILDETASLDAGVWNKLSTDPKQMIIDAATKADIEARVNNE